MAEILQENGTRKNLNEIITNAQLREKVSADYDLGNYESSITKAFEFLEEAVASGSAVRNDLNAAEELRAIQFKLKGAMNWFKEPEGNDKDYSAAAQILSYVDLQLNLLLKNNN